MATTMHEDIKKELELLLQQNYKDMLDALRIQCEYIYKLEISKSVYNKPQSAEFYINTKQLIDSVKSEVVGGNIYIWHDLNPNAYFNWNKKVNVTEQVPYWVNYGHNGIWHRDKARYVESAMRIIKKNYDVNVTILNPDIPWVDLG